MFYEIILLWGFHRTFVFIEPLLLDLLPVAAAAADRHDLAVDIGGLGLLLRHL